MIGKVVTNALTLAVFALLIATPAHAFNGAVLYEFTGSPDGANPQSRLTFDGTNFYATTNAGGLGYGTVFELSPNGGGWTETLIYHFCSAPTCGDGAYPGSSYVTFDGLGNLYGTTSQGGLYGNGVVFELSPFGDTWAETVLYNFTGGADGANPENGLIFDADGNLYGCNELGVFELSSSGGTWTEKVIYEVGIPYGSGLTIDAHGNIFGLGLSTVFEVSPNGKGGWNPTVIYTVPSKLSSRGTLALDQAGNLFGTVFYGGNPPYETVYELTPGKKKWKHKAIFDFHDVAYVGNEVGGVVLDSFGDLYGTNLVSGGFGDGIVFEVIPPVGTGKYTHLLLWNFDGSDGQGPGSLIVENGLVYGATYFGGIGYEGEGQDAGYGVVFSVTP
jgi:uncharacterized repeat protein (TIGR03803 family)